MRLRNIPRAAETIRESPYTVTDPAARKGRWRTCFAKEAPLHLEIGTGKGRFLLELAATHPEINYIGLEKYSSVLLRLIEKQNELQLPNLLLIRGEAELLETYFAEGEIDKLYLNFSDPWPKDRHAKRRLTSRQFLARYDNILSPGATIEFKTDNRPLFDFSLAEAELSPFAVSAHTFHLHRDPVMNEGNILTEYEARFSGLGHPICKMILERRKEGAEA